MVCAKKKDVREGIKVHVHIVHLSIDGVLPLVDVVFLGIGSAYTIFVVNWAEVVVKYL